jgi:hypothetical protein
MQRQASPPISEITPLVGKFFNSFLVLSVLCGGVFLSFPRTGFSSGLEEGFPRACASLLQSADSVERADAESRASRLLERRGIPVREVRRTFQVESQDLILVYGVPEHIQRLEHDPNRVFRRYTRTSVRKIVETSVLKSGPRPYIHPTSHARWIYEDLSGPMFTDPDFPVGSLWMDFDESSDWVDFTLPHPIPVLECSPGNYLIPAQKDYPEWMRKGYEAYLKNGTISPGYPVEEFQRITEEGGMRPAAQFQIRPIRFREKGVIFSVP